MNRALTAAVICTAFLIGGSTSSFARRYTSNCEKKVHRAEEKLHDAERKHGKHSRQAEKKREELERAKSDCR